MVVIFPWSVAIGAPYPPEVVARYILYPAKSLSVLAFHVNVTDEVAEALTISVTATVFGEMPAALTVRVP